MKAFTHLDEKGNARMVDVTEKISTHRVAVACGSVLMKRETVRLIMDREAPKGDVLGVARVAGIMAAKKTAELIPMCHPLSITSVRIDFEVAEEASKIYIESKVKVTGQTGVEMEALTAVSVAALTIYDMCKSVDKGMTVSDIMLLEKSGGKSGLYKRNN